MRSHWLKGISPAGFHRLHYLEWGDAGGADQPLVCVHGLTRSARDFDALAGALADTRHVYCLDVVGRGQSGWLANPASYGYPQYMNDAAALIARLDVEAVDWVGTSMGGLLGMMLAAMPETPIRRLVVNDIGPFIPSTALRRIASYLGTAQRFTNLAAFEGHLRQVHAPFGPLTDAQWRHLAEHSHVRNDDGTVSAHYDPGIATAFGGDAPGDVDLWAVWDAVRCPTLVLHGAESDVLLPEVAAQMRERGPRAQVVTLAGIGHAPALMEPDQIDAVRAFLAT